MDKFCSDQIEGLNKLAKILQQYEVNFWIVPPKLDMAYIEMADVPRSPHAIYDPHTKSYDIWKWGRKRPGMKHINLSADDAAEILSTEYFLAKAKRVRKHYPNMSIVDIVAMLRRGYQHRRNENSRFHH